MQLPRIDDFPLLTERLGKASTDRIRYHQQGTGRRQSAATNLTNPLQKQLACLDNIPYALDDILSGVISTIEAGTKPLSMARLFNLFQCMPLINTREIQIMMSLDERQARRYMQAAKLALPLMQHHFNKYPLRSIHAPKT